MTELVYIGIGGCLGAISRFLVSRFVGQCCPYFPLGTLLVNVTGSLLLGFISYSVIFGKDLSTEMRGLINIGFIGAFTTMSTFAFETTRLADIGQTTTAWVNVVANVALCILAVMVGRFLAVILVK